jgi:hypothetical protein
MKVLNKRGPTEERCDSKESTDNGGGNLANMGENSDL